MGRSTIHKILELVGLLVILSALYSVFHRSHAAYSEHLRLQRENTWLYHHCLENARLRDVSDACDKAILLFARSPLQTAMLPSLEQWAWCKERAWACHDAVSEFVARHAYVCAGAWLGLILIVPRLMMPWIKRRYYKEKESLIRQARASVRGDAHDPMSVLRFRPKHGRSMV